MQIIKSTFFSLCLFCFLSLSKIILSEKKYALTVVPVADLLLQQIKTLYPKKAVHKAYQNISLEGGKKFSVSCPRSHQLLFNEQVKIIHQTQEEVLVEISNCFYLYGSKKKNRYWTHIKNIVPFETLKKRGIKLELIPQPITFNTKNIKEKNKNIVTLIFPFHDKKNNRIFSAGTRFIRNKSEDTTKTFASLALNPEAKKLEIIHIPKNLCFSNKFQTDEEKRRSFVDLLKKWSGNLNGFIPYVWGGCSVANTYKKNEIHSSNMVINQHHKIPVFWQIQKKVANGLDCCGAILRAAQIFNIPYFYKNSSTALKSLNKITGYSQIKNGDIIYISGHLMVVSDIENNKLIEARSHWHGYGKLQEKKLSKIFKGIENYKQLISAKTLTRIDINEKAADFFSNIHFLKLTSKI